MQALKVFGVCEVSLPSGMRSGATVVEERRGSGGGGSEQMRVGADALGEDDEDVRPGVRALASGGSGAGVRSDIPCRAPPASGEPHADGVHHAVDEAGVGRRGLEEAAVDVVGPEADERADEREHGQQREPGPRAAARPGARARRGPRS